MCHYLCHVFVERDIIYAPNLTHYYRNIHSALLHHMD